MSDFGHDLIPTATSSGSQPTATDSDSSIWDQIEDGLQDLGDDVVDELNDIANDVADKLAAELGISQWYSIHVMTACEGNFAPNATSPGAWYNTTNCTAQSAGGKSSFLLSFSKANHMLTYFFSTIQPHRYPPA